MKNLRDRCKGRAFDRAWSSYSSAFQEYFLALSQAERTKYINTNIKKVEGKRVFENEVMKAFDIVERVRKLKLREDEVGTEGCIQEEAECRVGGRDKLEKAVKRGLLHET